VGAVGMLCIQRTLSDGKLHGIFSGLGAATADALYSIIAAFGLTFLSSFLLKEQALLRLFGGVFLCYIGVRIFLSRPAQQVTSGNGSSYLGNYISAFFLTLANPITFLAFAAVFASLGLASMRGHYVSAGLLVTGVFFGSGLWWFALCVIAGTVVGKLAYSKLTWLNRISGAVITGFGLFVLFSLII
jgi:threonine/homoserine/homoserine lactone efflux protein